MSLYLQTASVPSVLTRNRTGFSCEEKNPPKGTHFVDQGS